MVGEATYGCASGWEVSHLARQAVIASQMMGGPPTIYTQQNPKKDSTPQLQGGGRASRVPRPAGKYREKRAKLGGEIPESTGFETWSQL